MMYLYCSYVSGILLMNIKKLLMVVNMFGKVNNVYGYLLFDLYFIICL